MGGERASSTRMRLRGQDLLRMQEAIAATKARLVLFPILECCKKGSQAREAFFHLSIVLARSRNSLE
jgi:hypothetical protein